MRFNPKKYSCSICGKSFRRKKQHFNHVMRGHKVKTKVIATTVPQIEQELVSMKDEIVHSEPQTTEYYGAEYTFNNILTGNRHMRTGLPLPRISKYRRQAI